jgi:hypothetical protein
MIPSAPNPGAIPVNRPPGNNQAEVRQASPAQIAANRLNAQKSTGPRTATGKAASSRNARKHGHLARAVLVNSHSLHESSREFKKVCADYYTSLKPVGPIEEMLVDRIVAAVWRLRRVRHAESGEIGFNLDFVSKKSDEPNPVPILLQAAEVTNREDVLRALEKSVPGCEFVLARLRDACAAVRRDEQLTPDTFGRLNSCFRGRAKKLTDPLYQMAVALETNPAKLDPVILLEDHQREVLNFLDRQIQYFEEILAARRKESQSDTGNQVRLGTALLPSGSKLEQILRYETVLERQISHALAELKKLQLARLPPSIPSTIP